MRKENKMESKIKQKILEYLKINNISKYSFYKMTGITRGILDFDTGMSEKNIYLFIEHCHINPLWLFLDMGEMELFPNEKIDAYYIINMMQRKIEEINHEKEFLQKELISLQYESNKN